ncbi:MAG: hypothetical protein Q8M06_11840 [Methanobacteriaceae archaeon]|nr:hypothetical protein [Methanobacteriaceae archaeon]
MALIHTLQEMKKCLRKKAAIILHEELAALDTRVSDAEAGVVAEGSISTDELANGAVTESKLGTGAVTSGKLGNGEVGTAKLADDAVNKDKLKFVTREVTILDTAATGTVTNEADIDGVVLGAYMVSGNESPLKGVDLDPLTGELEVSLMSAQSSGDAVAAVVVLQV